MTNPLPSFTSYILSGDIVYTTTPLYVENYDYIPLPKTMQTTFSLIVVVRIQKDIDSKMEAAKYFYKKICLKVGDTFDLKVKRKVKVLSCDCQGSCSCKFAIEERKEDIKVKSASDLLPYLQLTWDSTFSENIFSNDNEEEFQENDDE